MDSFGKLIIITGTTGSGKDTIVTELRKINPSWKQIITSTTRAPRQHEKQDIDYHFLDTKTFQKMKLNGDFIETVEYAGNNYGTLKSALNPLLKGDSLLWIIDASRSAKINELIDSSFNPEKAERIKENIKVIYIDLPDTKTLYERLKKRNMSESDIKKRIKQDEKNWKAGHFDNIVVNYNGHLDETVQKVMEIIS